VRIAPMSYPNAADTILAMLSAAGLARFTPASIPAPMPRIALIGLVALALAPAALSQTQTIPPPAQPGAWRQLGTAPSSKPGALLHFFRQLQNPHALAVVWTSSSRRPIKATWWDYCEFQSDDGMTQEYTGTASGVGRITRYLPVMDSSDLCQVQVTAKIAGQPKVRVSAAVFGY